jgi:hypothetical protein
MSIGFRPTQGINANGYTAKVQSYYVPSSHATLLAIGDLVVITGDVTTVDNVSYANVDAAAAAGLITGALVGVQFIPDNFSTNGALPAGTGAIVQVAPAFPDQLFVAEVSQAIATTSVGQNAALLATAATTTGGLTKSNMVINASSFGTGSNQIRLENLVEGDIASGSQVYCRINPAFSTVAASVGV